MTPEEAEERGWKVVPYQNEYDDAGAWLVSPSGERIEHSYAAESLSDFADTLNNHPIE